MRFREWIMMLSITGVGILAANFLSIGASVADSLPGVLILLVISLLAVVCQRFIPLKKLPVLAYCSIIGLLLACPISPISSFVIASAAKINFSAPLAMMGTYAGISISNQLRTFVKQGWKMIVLSILIMLGTFTGSLLIADFMLKVTGVA